MYGNQVAHNEDDLMSENASRHSGARRRRSQQQPARMTREEREAVRKKVHEELIERYKKLIPIIKYKKNKDIDEFGTADCVICMEEFSNGVSIRKIPTCRHIFHSECIMKWLSGPNQQEQQRCPMCNEEITLQLLEKAIAEESGKKRSTSIFNIMGRSGRESSGSQVGPGVNLDNSQVRLTEEFHSGHGSPMRNRGSINSNLAGTMPRGENPFG